MAVIKKPHNKISLILIAVLLCCTLVLLPVLCSVLYFSGAVSTRLETTARETVSFYMNQFVEQTSAVLNTLRGSVYFLISDKGTQDLMRSERPPTQLERLAVEEGLSRAFFLSDRLDTNVVTGIYLVKSETDYLSVQGSGVYGGASRRVLEVYRTLSDRNSARDLYLTPAISDYCYFIVDYLDLNDMRTLGKVVIELRIDALVDTSYIDAIYREAAVLLRSTDGTVLYGPENTAFADSTPDSSSGYLSVQNADYYHAGRSLEPFRARVDIFVPESEIFETVHETFKVYIFFTAIVLLVTLGIGAALVYLLYKPLRQMLHKIDLLAQGDLTVRMNETPYRETEKFALAFNDMADRLEELFDEVYQKGLLLRDAELGLLESQIRPHFIFNVLELINMRCLAAGQNAICHTVSNLAQLIRANVTHKHEQTITFQEELRYVRYYLELQKERFEDALRFTIDLEDSAILQYYLPKLTIQPLVENSIVHGLESKRGGGSVHVSIWEEEDAVCVRVADDGVGFDASSLSLDLTADKDSSAQHNHVALANINRRIQLLYGSSYGMLVNSVPGRGTDILLTLPVDTNQISERGERRC